MTKDEVVMLISYLKKELVTDNEKFLGWQREDFVDGWLRAVGNVELSLEDFGNEFSEQGKLSDLKKHIEDTRKKFVGELNEYSVEESLQAVGFYKLYSEIQKWFKENWNPEEK